ncbi:hypothetical protein JG559_07620 [Enterococcus faecalis]|uniref:Uncharacterized protein n=1 Tax=Enterococcus faecalis TaxID=1351 RepID=A0A974S6M2_ENTFL|nr:hypothetical protein JG559_07620 [Enterococcus faecalis]
MRTKKALSLYSAGKASVPLRTNIDVPKKQRTKLIYADLCRRWRRRARCQKSFPCILKNIKKKLTKCTKATMIVLDPETGMVSACLDGTYLTQLRTGAVQGATTELLAKRRC